MDTIVMKDNKAYVFTYGTLMKEECNHYLIGDESFVSKGSIKGYKMYNVGLYPAIIESNGYVLGELYLVNYDQLHSLDALEDEGNLYIRKITNVLLENGTSTMAYIYVYNKSIDDLELCGKGVYSFKSNNQYVWYVGYGSNLLEERFMLYIKGGSNIRLGLKCPGSSNKKNPLDQVPYEIPYDMYFAMKSSKWENKGVSFLDTDKKGFSYGKAYLITYEQYLDVRKLEGSGWYDNNKLLLGYMDEMPVYTITHSSRLTKVLLGNKYKSVLIDGLKETYGLSLKEIDKYINKCMKN